MVDKIRANKPSAATKGMVSAAAAVAAAAMVVRPLIPMEIQRFVLKQARQFLTAFFSNDFVIVIKEFEGLSKNELFKAAETYTAALVGSSTRRCRAALPTKEKNITVSMEAEEELADEFRGMKLQWRLVCSKTSGNYSNPVRIGYSGRSENQFYELTFHRKFRARVLEEYLPYILEKSKAVAIERKSLKLYSYEKGYRDETGFPNSWKSVILDHPSTFDTLAMDPDQKQFLINDIDQFLARKEVYRKIGRAWKRGYLLYGPPGTGKSSLIAAMANYLKFDVYDLELTAIKNNTELQRLMTSTANQSILVVEDIDCSIELTEKREAKKMAVSPYYGPYGDERQTITLSGLLNFIDGLRSSCGDERIIIFTTNHIEKLDPALLRPGRMDVHIHMSYCTPSGFRLLASNYLGITEHPLFADVEKELAATAKVTPAEIGEHLLRYGEPDVAIKGLIQFLEEKRKMIHQQVSEQESTSLLEPVSEQVSEQVAGDEVGRCFQDNIMML